MTDDRALTRFSYEERPDDEDHEALGRPFRVKAVIRNNRLIKAREALGYMTQMAAAEKSSVSVHLVNGYETFKVSPWSKKNGDWTVGARKIAAAYGYSPEELWPEVIREIAATAMVLELGLADVEQLSPGHFSDMRELRSKVREALLELTPRERRVIEGWFGFDGEEKTLREIGESAKYGEGISVERQRQIAMKALRKLRHPSIAKTLAPFAKGD